MAGKNEKFSQVRFISRGGHLASPEIRLLERKSNLKEALTTRGFASDGYERPPLHSLASSSIIYLLLMLSSFPASACSVITRHTM